MYNVCRNVYDVYLSMRIAVCTGIHIKLTRAKRYSTERFDLEKVSFICEKKKHEVGELN